MRVDCNDPWSVCLEALLRLCVTCRKPTRRGTLYLAGDLVILGLTESQGIVVLSREYDVKYTGIYRILRNPLYLGLFTVFKFYVLISTLIIIMSVFFIKPGTIFQNFLK
jgi:hypothetical protein